jgi:ParB/RepB/Spo0J family partition protein
MSRDIPIALIDRDPTQPRQYFDAVSLSELAQSIGANGLAVPILVRPAGERYVIVHGERRYRAVCSLGHETIAADVRDMPEDEAQWLALVENVQRANLSSIEEARAYQTRLSMGMTQAQLGERIGKTQSYIATKLRFLKLPTDVQAGLDQGLISEGHAKQLLRLDDPEGISALYTDIVRLKSPVREVVAIVDHYCKMRESVRTIIGHMVEMSKALQKVKAKLTPEQFDAWCQSKFELTPSLVAALEKIAAKPPKSLSDVPDALIDHIIFSIRAAATKPTA